MTKLDDEYKIRMFPELIGANEALRREVTRLLRTIEDLEDEVKVLVGFLDDKYDREALKLKVDKTT